mgnify:CR=1 FL=1
MSYQASPMCGPLSTKPCVKSRNQKVRTEHDPMRSGYQLELASGESGEPPSASLARSRCTSARVRVISVSYVSGGRLCSVLRP